MKDTNKTKKQLINELVETRRRIVESETERKQAEFQLERLCSIVGVFEHDISGALVTISGYSELLLLNRDNTSEEEVTRRLQQIRDAVEILWKILDSLREDLREFSSGES